jgi:hypothetical protein
MQEAMQGLLNEWLRLKGSVPPNAPDDHPVGLHVRLTLKQLRELEQAEPVDQRMEAAAPVEQRLEVQEVVKSDDK